jgi:predicted DNA-binding transcriptional regulator YafY
MVTVNEKRSATIQRKVDSRLPIMTNRNRRAVALRMPSTRPPLRRLYWTLAQLRAGAKLNASHLAKQFGVGLRTAYRDLDFLRDAWRVPMEFNRADVSFRLTEPTTSLPAITLSEGELVALFFAEKVVQQYRGTPFEGDLTSAFRKIQSLLPDEVSVLPDRIVSLLAVDLGPLPEPDAAVFQEVVRGLVQRQRLLIRYRSLSSNRTLDRKVDPYRVVNLRGCWYLIAWDDRRRAVRDFALHRILRVTATSERYLGDPTFDLEEYMARAFSIEKGRRAVNVVVRFAARQARWIRERSWHSSARIQERLDGGCVLRMRVAPTSELRRWVMQFGSEAEVLAPKALRTELAEQLDRARQLYPARKRSPEERKRDAAR